MRVIDSRKVPIIINLSHVVKAEKYEGKEGTIIIITFSTKEFLGVDEKDNPNLWEHLGDQIERHYTPSP